MVFRLTGIEPRDETGKIFTNVALVWRPLWKYIYDACNDVITVDEWKCGCGKTGVQINADKARRIAIRLEHFLRQGMVKKHIAARKERMSELLNNDCDWYSDTGLFPDNAACCNNCAGTRGPRSTGKSRYFFTESDVMKFVDFARSSGGFKIA